MAEPVLRLSGVVKDYGREVVTRALHGVSFELRRGEFAALIGPSGSGKSTLLHLMGLLDRPTEGTIRLSGADTGSLDDDGLASLRGRTLGFVFQFHHLIPALTALENVMVPLWVEPGFADRRLRARALALLAAVGLAEQADRRSDRLSGGQQQRVAVARALANDPALVLADEPTGNLDTRAADEVLRLLRRFNRERGTTFLVVTHDARLAERTDRIVELVDGRIQSDRKVDRPAPG
jgi:lipoprotein-releasing system ATP-binding protein